MTVADNWWCICGAAGQCAGCRAHELVGAEGMKLVRDSAVSAALNDGRVVPAPRLGPARWRYSDEERPRGRCYDCNRPYGGEFGFPDLLIDNAAWEAINPTMHEGAGLLCPSCIIARLVRVGLKDVDGRFVSGPLAAPG